MSSKLSDALTCPECGWLAGHNIACRYELRQEIERLEKLVYVPGLWRCAKCNCETVCAELHAVSGRVRASNEPQTCPNGCGPMWRVTERDAGNRLVDRADAMRQGLLFIHELAGECLDNGDVRVGSAAEVAMRHIWRRAEELLEGRL